MTDYPAPRPGLYLERILFQFHSLTKLLHRGPGPQLDMGGSEVVTLIFGVKCTVHTNNGATIVPSTRKTKVGCHEELGPPHQATPFFFVLDAEG